MIKEPTGNQVGSLYIHDYKDFSAQQMEIVMREDSLCSQELYEKVIELNSQDVVRGTGNKDTCSNKRAEAIIAFCREKIEQPKIN